MSLMKAAALAALLACSHAADDGLALTPPMGVRVLNALIC